MSVTINGTTGITSPAIDVTTPITTTDGGTGLSSFTANGAMFATTTSALTTGTLPVASGGTGQTTTTAAFNALSPITTTGDLIVGNGVNSATRLAIGANNTVLTSNGSTATWAAAGGGSIQSQVFTSPGTWTRPSSVTQVRVTVVGGGAGTGSPGSGAQQSSGGSGGLAVAIVPVSNPVAITVGGGGSGGNPAGGGGAGGTSSFGSLVSCTGGSTNPGSAGSPPQFDGNPGTGTVSAGTTLKITSMRDAAARNLGGTVGLLSGVNGGNAQVQQPGISPALTYSLTSTNMAGAGGSGAANPGGFTLNSGGVSGAVVVEWVG